MDLENALNIICAYDDWRAGKTKTVTYEPHQLRDAVIVIARSHRQKQSCVAYKQMEVELQQTKENCYKLTNLLVQANYEIETIYSVLEKWIDRVEKFEKVQNTLNDTAE